VLCRRGKVAVAYDGTPRLGALAFALVLAGCRSRENAGAGVESATHWSAPADDVGEPCADVSDLRVCWAPAGPLVVARALPAFLAPSLLGFRCYGSGSVRSCGLREASAGRFSCDGTTCTQNYARQPDEGEWTCSDDAGIAVCVGSERAAGVSTAGTDPGWLCGERRRARDRLGDRVCIDLSPDFPEGRATGFRCRWSYDRGASRVCVRDSRAHVVGDACDAARPCVLGALCTGARCVVPKPRPSCALDADCEGGSCRFGSCVETER
jgi:hypothetical protein